MIAMATLLLFPTLFAAAPATAQQKPDPAALLAAVVGIDVEVPGDARTAPRLGTHREGNGIVVSTGGLVLTIGYTILEAVEITLVLQDGRKVPAAHVAYDHESGFGLVRALQPLGLEPVRLGDSDTALVSQQVLIATRLGPADTRGAYVVSRREFAGPWEYLLERAIYTSPPHPNFAGAALFGIDGALLGVGSLLVADSAAPDEPLPGNLFVPINALKPIYDRLVADGRRAGPARPWLGLYAAAVHGRVFVDGLADGGPATRAGLDRGDLIVAVGNTPVEDLAGFIRAVWASGDAGATVTLHVLTRRGAVRQVPVVSMDRGDWLRLDPSL
jgi:serine protease Do